MPSFHRSSGEDLHYHRDMFVYRRTSPYWIRSPSLHSRYSRVQRLRRPSFHRRHDTGDHLHHSLYMSSLDRSCGKDLHNHRTLPISRSASPYWIRSPSLHSCYSRVHCLRRPPFHRRHNTGDHLHNSLPLPRLHRHGRENIHHHRNLPNTGRGPFFRIHPSGFHSHYGRMYRLHRPPHGSRHHTHP